MGYPYFLCASNFGHLKWYNIDMVKKTKIPIISELTPQGLLVVGLIVFALLIVIVGGIILAVMVLK